MNRFFTLLLAASCYTAVGQVRYVNEVFSDVTVTTDVVYGTNVTVLPMLQGQAPAAQPLLCDIYEPNGDTETDRPLIIYIHGGNFLPQYLNGAAVGTKTDSVAVELCSRYAKMGYVVASIDYRQGWNPLAATQSERTFELVNAIYRGVQDARTAVRFFRMSEETEYSYGIDTDKIGYFGEGTGGYVSYAASAIENYNDIIFDDMGAPILKFWTVPNGIPGADYIPMIIEQVNGDPEAVSNGFAPPGLLFGPDPVQLCIANHPGYSSDVSFQVNLGGALGDLNWLDEGDPAMISFQCPADQFAPYSTGVLVVPTTGENVVEVSGAYDIHDEINDQPAPNNNAFQSLGLTDPYSAQAVANGNMGWDGLYPVLNDYVGGTPTQPFDSAPWHWWDLATTELVDAANGTTIAATQLTLNPNMGPLEGRAYCDTIVGYSAPRMAALLGLASQGPGCMDLNACNFNALAISDDGSCQYGSDGCGVCGGDGIADGACDCAGNVLDACGVCGGDGTSCEGCTDIAACNFDENATIPDYGSCVFADTFYDCDGNCLNDYDGDGVCNELEVLGCTFSTACNYEEGATEDDGSCTYADEFFDCDGNCWNDYDGDGVCDELEVAGCTDISACNFAPYATEFDASCDYPEEFYDCDGNCLNDSDGDGVCEELEICGCTNPSACNYSLLATDNDGSCLQLDCAGICGGNTILDVLGVCGGDCAQDENNDGICDDLLNCANVGALFWQELELGVYLTEQSPIISDSLPEYGLQLTVGDDFVSELILNVPLVFVDQVTGGAFQVLSWSNFTVEGLPPGVALTLPQVLEGGSQACVELTGDDYPTEEGFYEVMISGEVILNFFGTPFSIGNVATSFLIEVVSNPNGVPGCMYTTASNYMPWATYDVGICEFAGCTDSTALNYSPRHTVDDGSCFYVDPNCVTQTDCTEDLNGDGFVGSPDLLLMLGEYGNACD